MSWQITIDSDDCPYKLKKWEICTLTYLLQMKCNKQHCPKKEEESNSLFDYELQFCEKCYQMTNHLDGICQKCKAKE